MRRAPVICAALVLAFGALAIAGCGGQKRTIPTKTAESFLRQLDNISSQVDAKACSGAHAKVAALLAQARQEVDKYRTEHGTSPTAGQLAARLRVNSTDAAQALALMNLDREHTPTTPVRTVNGQTVKASR